MRAHSFLTFALVLAFPAAAAADARPVVLAVDGDKIYVGLGGKDGVGAEAQLELLHVVVAKDPATGAKLRDEFALGVLTVERAGDHVALARAETALAGRVAAGDHVRLVGGPRSYRDPWQARVAAVAAEAPATVVAPPTTAQGAADAAEVRAAWQTTLGLPLADRIARWQRFLADQPRTAYAAAIRAEIASLEKQEAAREAAIAEAARPTADRADRIAALATALTAADAPLVIDAPPRAGAGAPVALAFLVRDPRAVATAALFARGPGGAGFKRIELVRDGDAYLRGEIPKELVAAPGVDWYVEVIGADGAPAPSIGSHAAPHTIRVDAPVGEAPDATGRSQITLAADYVDFDGGLAAGFDQYVQAELDFTYRFIEPIYAFRIGFGTLSGVGGPKDVIDEDPARTCRDAIGAYRCRRVSFNYAYAEVEYRVRPTIAVMIRPQAGLVATDSMPDSNATRCTNSSDVDECRFTTGFGLRARVRLGEERSTNLVLGAGFTDGVGTVLEARYHWRPMPVLPIVLSVEVTDQPVPEDFGVRLIGDVGWRGLSWFYPSIRLAMQARDIDHTGFSGGAALNFDW
jgi:hypothetical protein